MPLRPKTDSTRTRGPGHHRDGRAEDGDRRTRRRWAAGGVRTSGRVGCSLGASHVDELAVQHADQLGAQRAVQLAGEGQREHQARQQQVVEAVGERTGDGRRAAHRPAGMPVTAGNAVRGERARDGEDQPRWRGRRYCATSASQKVGSPEADHDPRPDHRVDVPLAAERRQRWPSGRRSGP